jgi:hypothetical protein
MIDNRQTITPDSSQTTTTAQREDWVTMGGVRRGERERLQQRPQDRHAAGNSSRHHSLYTQVEPSSKRHGRQIEDVGRRGRAAALATTTTTLGDDDESVASDWVDQREQEREQREATFAASNAAFGGNAVMINMRECDREFARLHAEGRTEAALEMLERGFSVRARHLPSNSTE